MLGRLAARADAGGALHDALTKHVLAQARPPIVKSAHYVKMLLFKLLLAWSRGFLRSPAQPRRRIDLALSWLSAEYAAHPPELIAEKTAELIADADEAPDEGGVCRYDGIARVILGEFRAELAPNDRAWTSLVVEMPRIPRSAWALFRRDCEGGQGGEGEGGGDGGGDDGCDGAAAPAAASASAAAAAAAAETAAAEAETAEAEAEAEAAEAEASVPAEWSPGERMTLGLSTLRDLAMKRDGI